MSLSLIKKWIDSAATIESQAYFRISLKETIKVMQNIDN